MKLILEDFLMILLVIDLHAPKHSTENQAPPGHSGGTAKATYGEHILSIHGWQSSGCNPMTESTSQSLWSGLLDGYSWFHVEPKRHASPPPNQNHWWCAHCYRSAWENFQLGYWYLKDQRCYVPSWRQGLEHHAVQDSWRIWFWVFDYKKIFTFLLQKLDAASGKRQLDGFSHVLFYAWQGSGHISELIPCDSWSRNCWSQSNWPLLQSYNWATWHYQNPGQNKTVSSLQNPIGQGH